MKKENKFLPKHSEEEKLERKILTIVSTDTGLRALKTTNFKSKSSLKNLLTSFGILKNNLNSNGSPSREVTTELDNIRKKIHECLNDSNNLKDVKALVEEYSKLKVQEDKRKQDELKVQEDIEVKTEQLNFLDKIPKPNEKPENSKESVGNFTKNRKTFCGEKNLPGQMRLNVTLPIKKL